MDACLFVVVIMWVVADIIGSGAKEELQQEK